MLCLFPMCAGEAPSKAAESGSGGKAPPVHPKQREARSPARARRACRLAYQPLQARQVDGLHIGVVVRILKRGRWPHLKPERPQRRCGRGRSCVVDDGGHGPCRPAVERGGADLRLECERPAAVLPMEGEARQPRVGRLVDVDTQLLAQ